jgi:hypothetical protein
MTKIRDLNAKAAQATKLIAGAKKRFPNGAQQVTFGGTIQTVDEVTESIQTFVDNRANVETAKATTAARIATEQTQAPSLLSNMTSFTTFVRLTFGEQADVLADFGLEPTTVPTPLTAEQKAVAAAKRLATREARGTTSKKAKKDVKGNVTAKLVVTPIPPPVGGTAPTPTGKE